MIFIAWTLRRDLIQTCFNDFDLSYFFINFSLDNVFSSIENFILRGWSKFGVSKFIDKHSKPWLNPRIKRLRRKLRLWERRLRRFKMSPNQSLWIGDSFLSRDECEFIYLEHKETFYHELSVAKMDSYQYINKLLDSDVHKTVRRLYKHKNSSVPTLKIFDDNGNVKRVSSDSERVDVFNDQFLDNTKIPPSFSDSPERKLEFFELENSESLLHPYFFDSSGFLACKQDLGSLLITPQIFEDIGRVSLDSNLPFVDKNFQVLESIDVCEDFFSTREIYEARIKLKKGVGSVGIQNCMIRKLEPSKLDTAFQYLFNLYFYFHYWPLEWRSCTIFPLRKGGKTDFSLPENYRGISNVNTMGKFLEGIIFSRMSHLVTSEISLYQGGGLPGRGSVQTIIRLVESIQAKRFDYDFDERGGATKSNFSALVLLDVSKAFDRMDRNLIIDKIYQIGIRGRLFSFIVSYFHSRRQRVRIGDTFSEYVDVRNGGPQGSVIVLFTWLIYINDICKMISESEFSLFMDDVVLLISDTDSQRLVDRLNSDLQRIYGWAIFNRVTFNATKFHLFSIGAKKLKSFHRDQVFFGKVNPPWTDSAKYLGVIFDSKFSFTNYLTHIIDKVESNLWRVFNHSSIRNGSSPHVLFFIFRAYIMPHFEYAACVWIFMIFGGHIDMERKPLRGYITLFSKLETLYARCCKSVLGVPQSTSNVAVFVRLGVLPLRYHLALRSLVWYLRAYHGLASRVVQKQLFDWYEHDEYWSNSCFYQPSFLMLRRLSRLSGVNFWTVPVHLVAGKIRAAMFLELDQFWKSVNSSNIAHIIHPIWEHHYLDLLCHGRFSNSLYHCTALGRAKFLGYLFELGLCDSPYCRHGCQKNEDIFHVFFYCNFNREEIKNLKKVCLKNNIDYTIKDLFTKKELRLHVERFLLSFFSDG